jgi:competence protein ComFC
MSSLFTNNPLQTLLNLFFPKQNLYLSSFQTYLTQPEIESLQTVGWVYKIISTSKKNNHSKESSKLKIFVATEYHNQLIQDLILRAKFLGETEIAKDLAKLVFFKSQEFSLAKPDLITFVPPDPKRWKLRNYHLPAKISQNLAKFYHTKNLNLLTKISSTTPQTELAKKARLRNLKNKFVSKNISLKDQKNLENSQNIWLIDDLTTTGATLSECYQVLTKSYPNKQVICVVVAG